DYKTQFVFNEEFSYDGLKVKAVRQDGSSTDVPVSDVTVSCLTYKRNVAKNYTAVVKYGNVTKSYTVTVNPSTVVVGIDLSENNRSLQYGDTFNPKNLKVYKVYEDNRKELLDKSEYEVTPPADYDKFTLGEYYVSVKYGEFVSGYTFSLSLRTQLSVLMIGNSFSEDTAQYASRIAVAMGVPYKKVFIANIFSSGASLDKHWSNVLVDDPNYNYSTFTFTDKGETKDKLNVSSKKSINIVLQEREWDFVILQQQSTSAGQPDTFGNLQNLIDYIKEHSLNKDVSIGWNMTWAYEGLCEDQTNFKKLYARDQLLFYNSIVDTVKSKILTNDDISVVIPTGTAIQNFRTTSYGDRITRDGYHLVKHYSRYTAGLMLVTALTGRDPDLAPETVASDSLNSTAVTATQSQVAKQSVKDARDNPYKITQGTYVNKGSGTLSGTYKYNYAYTVSAYWKSTLDTPDKLTNSNDTSKKYIATSVFTNETLPVRQVLRSKQGYAVRAEGCTDHDMKIKNSKQPSENKAEGEVSNTFVEIKITEDWWKGYERRAFNVRRLDDVTGKYDELHSAFEIWIPLNTYSK
ncbi:MAG: DUF4886 domain-containing protein, partial [Clostridia bacterium]|nr:DUF4886 domain-containing protein [Clostridia bacterium]